MAARDKCSCGATLAGGTRSTRCPPCGALRVKVYRAVADQGPQFSADWKDFTKNGKINQLAFYEKARGTLPDDLAKLIELTHQEACSIEQRVQFIGSGTFMDEADLEAQYSGKPERLAAIKAHTRQMECPVSGVTLFEDMLYTSELSTTATRKAEAIAKGTAETQIKRVKIATTPNIKRIANAASDEVVETPLSPKQRDSLAKFRDAVEKGGGKTGTLNRHHHHPSPKKRR